jgi:hypothetical protein
MARTKIVMTATFRDVDLRLVRLGTFDKSPGRLFLIERNFNGNPKGKVWRGSDYYGNAADAVKGFYLAAAEQAPTL